MVAICLHLTSADAADQPARERLLLDFGWKFYLGDEWGTGEKLDKAGVSTGPARPDFLDRAWRSVNLPHDWAVTLPFDSSADRSHGYRPIGPGFPQNNIAWYRRTFSLPKSDAGRRLWLEFGGVYRDCDVFVNGWLIGHHDGGYDSFRYDITDVADCGGNNVVAIKVDASQFEGWFYEGAGIYRHVWLVKTSPLAVAPDGVFVYSSFSNNVPDGAATIHLETRLVNLQKTSAEAGVEWQILGPDGKNIVATAVSATMDSKAEKLFKQAVEISQPVLWSTESPQLYKLVTTVTDNGKIMDREETEFGIRTMAFDSNTGFWLNGKRCEIKGTCDHQDAAGVGVAVPDSLWSFRIARLKEMGCNAIRTSHNEPATELLEACDRLGMLVMDENRLLGSDVRNLESLGEQICRDRNHPCVFIWSLCNEEMVQRSATAARVFETMQSQVHQLDPTRLCTAAMNSWSENRPDGISTVVDVQGFNYLHNNDMDAFHQANPAKPCIGTEEASAFYSRGVYTNTDTYQSAYDDNKPGYGATAEEWWKYYLARPWASGAFVWTGFDYRGEPSPFGWPNVSSEFGILDACGFPKDVFYYYQSWWTKKPVLHLMPHWNWPGREGQNVDVRCFSNCREVELFLNGQSLGKKAMPENSHLEWNVKYAPGILSAKGYTDGKIVAEARVETTGAPAAIQLTPDRSTINVDGADCSVVTVAVTDAEGRVVPAATNLVHFSIRGPGKIIGVANGNQISHEPDAFQDTNWGRSLVLDDWRIKKIPAIKDQPEMAGDLDESGWQPADVHSDAGPLQPGESAVFCTHVQLTKEDLAAGAAILNFGMIDDEGWIYVNGRFIGQSRDWRVDPSFEMHAALKTGDNTILVFVKNEEGEGGINKGVTLDLTGKPVLAEWHRSVFNGLAQIIVQADQVDGEIQLRADAGGLVDGVTIIHTQIHPPRTTVP